MLGQPSFFAIGPAEISGNTVSTNMGNLGSPSRKYSNLYLTGTGTADFFSSRQIQATTGQINDLSVNNLYGGVSYLNRIETTSQSTNSGVFDYLGPTGKFFPPLLTFEMRTGIFSGYLTPIVSPYDGLLVYQMTSGQKLMIVQSGVWKSVNLS